IYGDTMKIIAIIIGKIITFFGFLLHRGSSLPGKVALSLDKNILKKFKYPEVRIAVTGSSGKGSTSSLIANSLRTQGYKVCFNDAGSNLAWGITSAFIKYCNLFGKIKADYLVIEIDERYAKDVFPYLKPDYVIITNITKDQPPRQFNVDIIYNELLTSIEPNTTIITNMDEPYLRNFAKDLSNKHIYYSIAKNKYSYKSQIFENLNTYHCPYCEAFLKYDYYNFETLGKYHCPKCSFTYETPESIGTNLDLEKQTITIKDKEILIGGDMLYHAYNTMAAYTTLDALKLDKDKIVTAINYLNNVDNRIFTNNQKEYYALSCKAENCTTYNQAIFKVIQDKRSKDIIIGWKEISRRYEHYDVSWLYDVEFELLNNSTVNCIYACGIDKLNIKKRLILAGIPEDKIVTADNIAEIKDNVLKSDTEIVYGILNFDYIEPFNQTFKEDTSCK
ncbi:MAG: MurT ligase domain-containing protein, partial [Bacilli bacterium]|nr:MurT ligase domain-containing protein [Bacilli bacterium]